MAALVSYEDSDESETEDVLKVEEEEKQKPSSLSTAYKQEIRNLVSVVPGNEDGGRSKVKIALPQPKNRHDSVDDDDFKSTISLNSGGSFKSLKDILPKPKHSDSTPTNNPSPKAKPSKATPKVAKFVPYTLTKRPNKPATPTDKPTTPTDNSDDEFEDSSFFSFLDSIPSQSVPNSSTSDNSSHPHPTTLSNRTINSTPTDTKSAATDDPSLDPSPKPPLVRNPHESMYQMDDTSKTYSGGPLPNTSTLYGTGSRYSYSQLKPISMAYDPSAKGSETGGEGSGQGVEEERVESSGGTASDDLQIDEEAVRRLAGMGSRKGRKRKAEDTSLDQMRDVSENELIDSARAFHKHSTEEQSYGFVPKVGYTGTQKRTHHISWLANQAKAKEIELKNFWAQGADARKASRMKYGF